METTHRSMNLSLSIEDKNGNNITCHNEHVPDSVSSSCSLSCGSSESTPDVEMVDHITCPATVETSSPMLVKSSSTIAMDFSKSKIDIWNKNMTILVVDTKCNDVSSETTPDSGEQEESEVDSCEPSQCGSGENCCSVSSAEMVMRSNSFDLHENDLPLSNLQTKESRTSLDISLDIGLVSGMLPDVCESLGKEPKNLGLGCTYIQPNQTFLVNEGSLIIEKHECITPVHYLKSNKDEQKLACNSGGSNHSTPVEGKTMIIGASEDLDLSSNAQTSTPVQSVSNKTFRLPSLSESPLDKDKEDSVSPMAEVRSPDTAFQKPKASLTSGSKSNKIEIKRFPKPNFSNIKSKIISRASNTFKPPKTSSNSIPQSGESHTMNQPKPSSSKSTSSAVTSTFATKALNAKGTSAVKRTRSSTCQESGPVLKSRPRRWSESVTSSTTSKDGSQEKNPKVNGVFYLTTPQKNTKIGSQNQGGKTKPADTHESTRGDVQGNESRGNQRFSFSAVSAKPAACEWNRDKLGPPPSPARTGGASAAYVPAANLRPPLSASKLKPGTAGKNGRSTTDMPSPKSKLSSSDVSGSQSRPAVFAAPTSASRLPVKSRIQPKSFSTSQTNGYSKQDHTEPSVGTLNKPAGPSHRMTLRGKLQFPPNQSVSSGCKNASVRSSSSPMKTPTTARLMRPASNPTVDKNKSRTSSCSQQPQTIGQTESVPPESKSRNVEYYKSLCEKKNQTIQQLENTLRSNNRRFEAVAVVINHLYAGHEEVMKQRRELSQELVNLREELVNSAYSCERLEQEKEELRAAFDGVLQKVQEQHHLDLADLEERLKTFYSNEWEKVHQTYQEEADKCKAQMEQQLEELRSKHEALKEELEVSHLEEVGGLKRHFEESFKELKQSHEKEMQTLHTTLKESEDTLSNQIQELMTENNNLKEKLNAEVKRRMDLAEKSQDSHTLYLEQELESLKVVLDIKNKQLHEQDKKLLQLDKLIERNVLLDECLKKLQQENEDLKARMDKHAALSRQLSTEQAVLQESLQKESKVNKRLSMENEELLWKLNNGDLSSPRKVSPSPSLTLQSPRNSGLFSSPPVSPR